MRRIERRAHPALPRAAAALAAFGAAVALAAPSAAREPVVGGPCEGCEAVFEEMPETLTARARIAPPDAGGEPLVIEGRVSGADGAPRAGIVVYAYQTDASGIYPRHPRGIRHGRLRGWARTDDEGRYRFDTIRPGGYPDSGIPQHVHFHVVEPGRCTYWIGDLLFDDDPRLTPRERARAVDARGGSGLASPARDADGAWRARRDIRLGLGIPGYERCGG